MKPATRWSRPAANSQRRPCVARGRHRALEPLDSPLVVGEGAVDLGPERARQHGMRHLELRIRVARHDGYEGHLGQCARRLGQAQQLRALQHQGAHAARAAGREDRRDPRTSQAQVQAALRIRVAILPQQDVVRALPQLELRVADAEVEHAAHRLGERAEGEQVLVGRLRRCDEGGRRAGSLDPGRDLVESGGEADPVPRGPAPQAGARDPVGNVDLLVKGAPDVAHPRLVDVDVAPRPQPIHLSVALVDVDVAARGAAGADGLFRLQEPDAHLEAEVVGEEGSHRAHVGEVARVAVLMGRFSKVEIWVWSPRLTNSKLFVPVTSFSKRMQREQSTQRSASSMMGPRSDDLALPHLLLDLHLGRRAARAPCTGPADSTRPPGRRPGSRSDG